MNFGIEKYLQSNTEFAGDFIWNLPQWQASTVGGAGQQVVIPENRNENRVFILVHYITVSYLNAAQADFRDTRHAATIIFSINGPCQSIGASFDYFLKARSLTIEASNPACFFSLYWQSITVAKKR